MTKKQLEELVKHAGSRKALARQLTTTKKDADNLYRQIGLYLQGKRRLPDNGKYAQAFRAAGREMLRDRIEGENSTIRRAGFQIASSSYRIQYQGGYLEVSGDRRKRDTPAADFSRSELLDFLILDAVEQREVFADKVGLPYFGYTDKDGNDLGFNGGKL